MALSVRRIPTSTENRITLVNGRPGGVGIAKKQIGQWAMFSEGLGVKIADETDLWLHREISKTYSVDIRRSSSTTGVANVSDGGLQPREVWALSFDDP